MWPTLTWTSPISEAQLHLKINIFSHSCFETVFPWGSRCGRGTCWMMDCVPFSGSWIRNHILALCPPTPFLRSFIHEALGHEWQSPNLGKFLKVHPNHIGRRGSSYCYFSPRRPRQYGLSGIRWSSRVFYYGKLLTRYLKCWHSYSNDNRCIVSRTWTV